MGKKKSRQDSLVPLRVLEALWKIRNNLVLKEFSGFFRLWGGGRVKATPQRNVGGSSHPKKVGKTPNFFGISQPGAPWDPRRGGGGWEGPKTHLGEAKSSFWVNLGEFRWIRVDLDEFWDDPSCWNCWEKQGKKIPAVDPPLENPDGFFFGGNLRGFCLFLSPDFPDFPQFFR